MGAFMDKPLTDKHNLSGRGNGQRYALGSMQGWRVDMEDAHTAITDIQDLQNWSFYAVYDGHAGSKVAAHCAENLLPTIMKCDEWKVGFEEGLKSGFLKMDEDLRQLPELISGEDKSGSTAVSALVSPDSVYFANLGDSRAVYARGGNHEHFSTFDHKPYNAIEKSRIERAGGSVMLQRVNGSLAVSRAFGDFEYKNLASVPATEQLVSPEPDVTRLERSEDDQFIILACDGIWDVMSNEDVVNFVRSRMLLTDDLEDICNQVLDTCLYKGSRDNMSIIIVAFEGAPRVDQQAKAREAELDRVIEESVTKIVQNADPAQLDLPYVMHMMSSEEIENLPPGGQLCAKRHVIENAFYKLVPKKEEEPGHGNY